MYLTISIVPSGASAFILETFSIRHFIGVACGWWLLFVDTSIHLFWRIWSGWRRDICGAAWNLEAEAETSNQKRGWRNLDVITIMRRGGISADDSCNMASAGGVRREAGSSTVLCNDLSICAVMSVMEKISNLILTSFCCSVQLMCDWWK